MSGEPFFLKTKEEPIRTPEITASSTPTTLNCAGVELPAFKDVVAADLAEMLDDIIVEGDIVMKKFAPDYLNRLPSSH